MSQATPAPAETEPVTPREHAEGLGVDVSGEEDVDRKLAAIEMAGEEVAAGWKPAPHERLSPEVRYLHVSRTIHQLVTDRNRSVGIFLFVASLLINASNTLLGVPKDATTIVPLPALQYWSWPVTFGALAVLAAFISLLLIRARIGLIFEVAKMHALLGLPLGRVERVNPLSIFYLLHLLVVLLGGASAGFTAGMLAWHAEAGRGTAVAVGSACGVGFLLIFQTAYYVTILNATSEAKLQGARV